MQECFTPTVTSSLTPKNSLGAENNAVAQQRHQLFNYIFAQLLSEF